MKAFKTTKKAAEPVTENQQRALPRVSFVMQKPGDLDVYAPALDWLAGDGSLDEVDLWKFQGCRIAAEVVLMHRTTFAPQLCLRLGSEWYHVTNINPGDPGLAQLRDGGHMQARGPSPSEAASNARRADVLREQQEREAAQARRTADRHRKIREAREAKEMKRRALALVERRC